MQLQTPNVLVVYNCLLFENTKENVEGKEQKIVAFRKLAPGSVWQFYVINCSVLIVMFARYPNELSLCEFLSLMAWITHLQSFTVWHGTIDFNN